MRLGAKIFGIVAGSLLLFLLGGLLLPGRWTARAEAEFTQTPEVIFPFLNRMDHWTRWTAMPDSASERFGPQEGAGAGLRWNDPQYGVGEVRIQVSHPGERVEYLVDIEEGALRIRGTLTLTARGEGSLLQWTEEGDFGWNPMMGYTALGMGNSQAEAMRAGLERLRALLGG